MPRAAHNDKIRSLIAVTVIASAATLLCACSNTRSDLPPIVEVFACGDYCPGPESKYIKRVYEGVSDIATCRDIGGKPYSYIGWGQHFLCLAD